MSFFVLASLLDSSSYICIHKCNFSQLNTILWVCGRATNCGRNFAVEVTVASLTEISTINLMKEAVFMKFPALFFRFRPFLELE